MKLAIARLFARLRKDEDGTQLVETAIWLGLISALTIAAVITIGEDVLGVFEYIGDNIDPPAAAG